MRTIPQIVKNQQNAERGESAPHAELAELIEAVRRHQDLLQQIHKELRQIRALLAKGPRSGTDGHGNL